MNEIKTPIHAKTENQIMELIQEFASSWSLVGGRYDDGTMLEIANNLKQEIRSDYQALQKENEAQAKRIAELELKNKCEAKELSWDDAEKLAENALISGALTAFSYDSTNDNAVGLIRYIVCEYNKIAR